MVVSLVQRVPQNHPLRPIKRRTDELLAQMNRQLNRAYSSLGRPPIPPEQLLKALLLQALYSIRSEIALMEHIEFNQLYRWFVDLPLEQRAWTPEVFGVNPERFAEHGLVQAFFDTLVRQAVLEGYVSDEHFTVDGTLIRSWASLKSVQPKDAAAPSEPPDDLGNPTVKFQGQRRTNNTHQSATDPQARLARKGLGREAQLCHSAHVLMENRHGLCVGAAVDAADGHAERRQAWALVPRAKCRQRLHPRTLGLDGGYQDGKFLAHLERTARADSPWAHRGVECGGAGTPTGAAADAHGAPPGQLTHPQTGRRNLRLVQDGGTAGTNPLRGSMEGIRLTNHVPPGQLIPHHEKPEVFRQPHTLPGYALDNLW